MLVALKVAVLAVVCMFVVLHSALGLAILAAFGTASTVDDIDVQVSYGTLTATAPGGWHIP